MSNTIVSHYINNSLMAKKCHKLLADRLIRSRRSWARTNRGNGLQEHRDYKWAYAAVPLVTDAFEYQDLGSDHAVYSAVFSYFFCLCILDI
jgi:hypothetical protein